MDCDVRLFLAFQLCMTINLKFKLPSAASSGAQEQEQDLSWFNRASDHKPAIAPRAATLLTKILGAIPDQFRH